jgi:Na+/H+ antiporter NhaD/arsenite permease-like protein
MVVARALIPTGVFDYLGARVLRIVRSGMFGTVLESKPTVDSMITDAMMYGATLGGNGTLFGASSNIVAAGICVREGRPLRYVDFARYGIPVMVVQLIVSAIYLKLRFLR